MVGMPRERPGDKFGTSQGQPGRLGRFMWKFTFKGQNVRGTRLTGQMTGQMGHVHGTDGTQTRGCPAKILYVYWFFFLSPETGKINPLGLVGLRTQTQNAAFFERKGPKRKPWPRGKSLNRKK